MNPYLLTTTIPYVNAKPHLGFALELVQADCLTRYYRKSGAQVFFRTGTDEHGLKNVEAARRNNVTPEVWVDDLAHHFRDLATALDIQFDDFIRTTETRHWEAVTGVISRINPGDLDRRPYRGLYCKECEDYWLERDLLPGLQCPEHRVEVTCVEEENIFFRLSRYQSELETLIESGTILIRPAERRNEILSFIRRGLQDISISRSADRAGGWGIPFPGSPDQIVYVWIDALINYLVASPQDVWTSNNRKIHVLGKNVWKFHAIYWPALLLSCGLPLPDELIIHGFVTIDGRKISKSSGPTVNPLECIEEYGVDAVRFYLLHQIPAFEDGDFSYERLARTYEQFLSNGLGNLTQRLLALAEISGVDVIERIPIPRLDEAAESALQTGRYGEYLDCLWREIGALNREIDQEQPWKWIKVGELARVRETCATWLRRLEKLAFWLEPALPQTSRRLHALLSAQPIIKSDPLFPRLNVHS